MKNERLTFKQTVFIIFIFTLLPMSIYFIDKHNVEKVNNKTIELNHTIDSLNNKMNYML